MIKFNVMIIGGGGREHALAWKIVQSPLVDKLYCVPGNAGTASFAANVCLGGDDVDGMVDFARDNGIDLTVVGPEAPLAAGIVDAFEAADLTIFGPTKGAAQLESSKAFMKKILTDAGVPTARYEVFTDRDTAVAALDADFGGRAVVKADGLAAGKGVVVAADRDEAVAAIDEMLVANRFGDAGAKIVLEELLEGEEASILAFCDGERVVMMPSSQDHKRIGDDDTGPNTGGMGAYSPAPVVDEAMAAWIEKNVIQATADAMTRNGTPYRGILYAGLMIGPGGPKVLEFNCRFGDPECQPIMKRLKSDLVPILLGVAQGDITGVELKWHDDPAVCVVMAAGGYPGDYEKGKPISGIADAGTVEGVTVFHAGTRSGAGGEVLTAGGRVLGVTATGPTIAEAIRRAYDGVAKITWEGAYHRTDIGKRALDR